tara:strand:- start:1886 stop:2698 length:813 start_codon:yes stop_codon:yes gene_type:complete
VELLVHATKQLSRDTEEEIKNHNQGSPVPSGYKVGRAYNIAGIWYYPYHDPKYDKIGIASWYGEQFHGRLTANGEVFDMNTVTAAHKTFALPSIARVTNLDNGRSLLVRVNDRGPFVEGRIIDLSRRSAQLLGIYQKGTERVRVEFVELASLKNVASNDSAYGLDSIEGKVFQQEKVEEALYQEDSLSDSIITDKMTYIQLGAFTSIKNAIRLKDKVSNFGPIQIIKSINNNNNIFKVRIGPLSSGAEVEKVLKNLSDSGFSLSNLIILK